MDDTSTRDSTVDLVTVQPVFEQSVNAVTEQQTDQSEPQQLRVEDNLASGRRTAGFDRPYAKALVNGCASAWSADARQTIACRDLAHTAGCEGDLYCLE